MWEINLKLKFLWINLKQDKCSEYNIPNMHLKVGPTTPPSTGSYKNLYRDEQVLNNVGHGF